MLKSALITIGILSVTIWGFSTTEPMLDGFKTENAYYHCVREAGAITDTKADNADLVCRELTRYQGE